MLIGRLGYWEYYEGVEDTRSPESYGHSRQHLTSVACLRVVAKCLKGVSWESLYGGLRICF